MDGKWFAFDSDTDGGIGFNGNAMAGIIVVVEFKDGTQREGVAVLDPDQPNRAVVQL